MMQSPVRLLTVLVFAGSLLAAQAQVKDKDAKKGDKGVKAKITKVDAAKKTISVSMTGGKKMDVLTTKDTKFIGPRGGASADGIKDDRVAVGNEIGIVFGPDKKTAREIHLPLRKTDPKKPKDKK